MCSCVSDPSYTLAVCIVGNRAEISLLSSHVENKWVCISSILYDFHSICREDSHIGPSPALIELI